MSENRVNPCVVRVSREVDKALRDHALIQGVTPNEAANRLILRGCDGVEVDPDVRQRVINYATSKGITIADANERLLLIGLRRIDSLAAYDAKKAGR